MNTKNLMTLKTKNLLMTLSLSFFLVFAAFAQDKGSMTYSEIEKTQEDIEAMYVQIYDILEEYPKANYTYVYEDGDVTEVNIMNLPDNRDSKQLQVYLMDITEMKQELANQKNRVGIYYMAETEPKPKMGFEEFYDKLHADLTYPKEAKDNGVEGTVFVRFVVDDDGNVDHLSATENIETSYNWLIDDLKKEAKQAVAATSGEWKPAEIGGIPVAQYAVIPVQFKLESPYFRPTYTN